jgi:hypothetical protein
MLQGIIKRNMDVRGVGVRVPVGSIIVITLYRPDFSPKKKQLGREADLSPPTGAEVKKTQVYTPIPHKFSWLVAWLVKHKDNFTFYLTPPFHQCVK